MAWFRSPLALLCDFLFIACSFLLLFPLDKNITLTSFRQIPPGNETTRIADSNCTRYNARFPSKGEVLHAWVYVPDGRGEAGLPVILTATGLGSQKDLGLEPLAEALCGGGLVAFVFDYRYFGGSTGSPRHVTLPWLQIEDWISTLTYVTSVDPSKHPQENSWQAAIDPSRVVLFGSSYGGAHVLSVGGKVNGTVAGKAVKGILAQVPLLDGRVSSRRALKNRSALTSVRMLWALLADLARWLVGMNPASIPVAAKVSEGGMAAMALSDEDYALWRGKIPTRPLGGWQNELPARVLIGPMAYRPIQHLGENPYPTLIVSATQDFMHDASLPREAVKLLPQGVLHEEDCTHFDVYTDAVRQRVIQRMMAFVAEHT
ncbi:unnamed protein product [Vitrella brassicaformis CCMP3155]|uniref:AB hydrolase-1 domain-containing protein n=1 Tax=Vitrella brassicaformis (strain CCMP3155) TaxID=1169540 RepID=A0A0G4G5S3_VITBC|nr:unnamed protein product [Vitrella brassicaformis CCMP3155]|eukprot:CEM23726.1 unnamed protein product [Vitrella brassicaformis CCMP3155]